MARETLFSTLTRSPWWLSLAIAAAIFAALSAFLPVIVGASAALPFAGIAAWAFIKQWGVPSADTVAERLTALRALDAERFSTVLADGLRREGYEVATHARAGADLELRRDGRKGLACTRRWKVAKAGAGPMKELLDAAEAWEADECLFVTAGELTPQARELATQRRVRVVEGAELARLVGRLDRMAEAPAR